MWLGISDSIDISFMSHHMPLHPNHVEKYCCLRHNIAPKLMTFIPDEAPQLPVHQLSYHKSAINAMKSPMFL